MRHIQAAVLAGLLCAGCTGGAPATDRPLEPGAATGSPSPPTDTAPPHGPTRPPLSTPDVPTVPPTPPGVTGEVPPELLQPVVERAADLAGEGAADVTVARAQQITWPDGSLGCPEPGEVYPQEPVDGYWVVLQVGEETYDFRLGESGAARLCPAGMGRPTLPSP